MLASEPPVTVLLQRINLLLVDVLIKIVQFGCEYGKATNPKALKDIMEDLNIIPSVINHAWNDNEFKSVIVLFWQEYVWIAEHEPL